MSYQTTESKKQEFRKYLEKTGVIDNLTRALVGLYEEQEKPENSIEFLKKNLGAPVEIDTLKLKKQLDTVKQENIRLRKQLEQYRKQVPIYQNPALKPQTIRRRMIPTSRNKQAYQPYTHHLKLYFRTTQPQTIPFISPHIQFIDKIHPIFTSPLIIKFIQKYHFLQHSPIQTS